MARTKRPVFDKNVDLINVDHKEILVMSRMQSGDVISNKEVSRRMGLGEEVVARYQRYPESGEYDYSLPAYRIPVWNAAVGNRVVSQWVAQIDGGLYVRVDGDVERDMNVVAQCGRVAKEAADVTACLLDAIADGGLDDLERAQLVKELRDARRAIDEALMAAEGRPTTGL